METAKMEAEKRILMKRVMLAYGMLWHLVVDKTTPDGELIKEARDALSGALTHHERGRGIGLARQKLPGATGMGEVGRRIDRATMIGQ